MSWLAETTLVLLLLAAIIPNFSMAEATPEIVDQMFNMIDQFTNNDQKLTLDEILKVLPMAGVDVNYYEKDIRQEFHKADVNKDGKLTKKEFAKFYVLIGKIMSVKK